MKQIINILSGNNRRSNQSTAQQQSTPLICNYQDNYYGDQVCVACKPDGQHS